MTSEEQRNLEQVALWEKTYNEDVERMVDEVYAEDCEVRNMFTGDVVRGREAFLALEREIEKQGPGRKVVVKRTVASGNVVALEAEGQFPGGVTLDGCVFLTFDEKGKIVSDNTYVSDPTGALSPTTSS